MPLNMERPFEEPARHETERPIRCEKAGHFNHPDDVGRCRCGKRVCPGCASEVEWALTTCGDEHCALMAVLALQRRGDSLAGAVEDFNLGVARAEERAAA